MRGSNRSLAAKLLARKVELEDALADCPPHDGMRRHALQTALAGVYQLITGDIAHPSDVVARAMAHWLERHRYLTA
jgi:hypothetical protein